MDLKLLDHVKNTFQILFKAKITQPTKMAFLNMPGLNAKLLRIGFQLFNEHWNKLNKQQRDRVLDIYYDFY